MLKTQPEPIAIIGIGCRFPGGIVSPESFWDALCNGKDAITEVPPDRWDLQSFYNSDREKAGKIYVRKGGFLDNIGYFDPQFFGISPREASFLDPQQRLLLEVTWEAFEDVGIIPKTLAGSHVGVFVGLFMHDYENLHIQPTEQNLIGPHSATGMSTTIAANRISYVFNFKGPSMIIDTACSSSLVAIHLACQSLINNESELAIAGGVNVIIKPEMTMALCKGSFLSPDGCCMSFDARANGYVRSEGAGMIVLKKLSRALADNNPVYALIRGTAVNQNGKSTGLTVPSETSQIAVMKSALKKAGIKPQELQYVEAHGTGTPVGDPIEAKALGAVLSQNRPDGDYCIIGSVKSNIGHTESSAGVAGVIKTALMLHHGTIIPNIHFITPNPEIPFEELKLRVSTSLEKWPDKNGQPRFAGINSFGFGGTNAHAVLEDFQPSRYTPEKTPVLYEIKTEELSVRKNLLFPLSTHTQESLQEIAESYTGFLKSENTKDISLFDIGYTMSLHKEHHNHRLSIVAESKQELIEHLEAFCAGEKRTGITQNQVLNKPAIKTAFIFSGMGQQWWCMGRKLFYKEPVFRKSIEECDALFSDHTKDWALIKELLAGEKSSRINETQIAQPCIFSVQVALDALWRSWGIVPDTVLGHSVGELAACYSAGILRLEDLVCVCFHRSRLQHQKSGCGGMLAVGLSAHEVRQRLENFSDKITIAAINSPASVTLAGDIIALESIKDELVTDEIFARLLKVDVPYHSPLMDSILPELKESCKNISPQQGCVPMVSTVTGNVIEGKEINVDYWLNNVSKPVLFANACTELINMGHDLFIEISAHPVLATSIKECLDQKSRQAQVLASLRRMKQDDVMMLGALGSLYTMGYPVDWHLIYKNKGIFIKLPGYKWKREYYWKESEESMLLRQGKRIQYNTEFIGHPVHPLLGARRESAMPFWTSSIDLKNLPYLEDHVVQGNIVFPGAAYIEIALAAAREMFGQATYFVKDLEIKTPLILQKQTMTTMQLSLERQERFLIYSKPVKSNQDWILHTSGRIGRTEKKTFENNNIQELISRLEPGHIKKDQCYAHFRLLGLEYGPCFQNIEYIWLGRKEVIGQIKIKSDIESELVNYQFHPVLLDACFQVLAAINTDGTYLPVKVESIYLYDRPEAAVWCYAYITTQTKTLIKGNIQLLNGQGKLLAEIKQLHCQLIEGTQSSQLGLHDLIYEYEWQLQKGTYQTEKKSRADYLISPESISQSISREIHNLIVLYNRKEYYTHIDSEIKNLCKLYIVEAFRKLGWDFNSTGFFTLDECIKKLGIMTTQHHLTGRLLEILEEQDILDKKENAWHIINTPGFDDPGRVWHELISKYPAFMSELLLIESCGSKLHQVLIGEEDPLSVLFSQTSSTTDYFYYSSPTIRIYNMIVQYVLKKICDDLPEAQTLRILEIGAGTGSMTSYILPLLPPNRCTYTFTDISAIFTTQAKEKFRKFKFIEYRVLDIEKEPSAQEFPLHSYDLILASNVIHATADLKKTLSNLKKLIVSGGLMILLEATNPPLWFDLVFGMLKGWWLFSDTDIRPSHPLLAREKWIKLLKTAGFSHISCLPENEAGYKPLHSIIIARGPMTVETVQIPEDSGEKKAAKDSDKTINKPFLIFSDNPGFGNTIADLLKKKQIAPIMISNGESYAHRDLLHFTINLNKKEDIKKVFDSVCKDTEQGLIVMYLCNSSHHKKDFTGISLSKQVNQVCITIVNIMQTLMQRQWKAHPQLWIVTNGTQTIGNRKELNLEQTPLWGMGRVFTTEIGTIDTRMLDLSFRPSEQELELLCQEILSPDQEDEIIIRGNSRYVNRLVKKNPISWHTADIIPFRINNTRSKGFEGFTFLEKKRKSPEKNEVEIHVHAAGVNFKDVAKTAGLLDNTILADTGMLDNLGMECSGIITRTGPGVEKFKVGDEVMGVVLNCFTNYVTTDPRALVHKPAGMSFEEAATVPLVFLTSYYALKILAKIKKGDRVLIHTAAGGIGLAAIQIALANGAEVLATAGTPEKREFLRTIGIKYTGDSRSLAFVDEIMQYTNHEGVDIVLNTLPAKTIKKSMVLLKPVSGCFIDLSNVYEPYLPVTELYKGISFYTIDLEGIILRYPELTSSMLQEIMEGFTSGEFHALPYRIFPLPEISRAFKYMRKGIHIGKVILSLTTEYKCYPIIPNDETIEVSANGTYLITGGLGGFGLAVAQWLVSCGARHLVLIGRSGLSTNEAKETVKKLEQSGAHVVVRGIDVTNDNQVRELIEEIDKTMLPLKGVMHAAMVLADSLVEDMDEIKIKKVIDPKITGAWNLHVHTIGKKLEFFILFSSFSTIVGNSEQSNYSAANYFLDSLAKYRRAHGLEALSINWGLIGDVGYVAKHEKIKKHLHLQGVNEISLNQAWMAFVYGIKKKRGNFGVFSTDWQKMSKYSKSIANSPRFSLVVRETNKISGETEQKGIDNIFSKSQDERKSMLAEILSKELAGVLGIPGNKLNRETSLYSMGFDSLMAVELIARIKSMTDLDIPKMTLVQQDLTMKRLVEIMEKQIESETEEQKHTTKDEIDENSMSPILVTEEIKKEKTSNNPDEKDYIHKSIEKLNDDEVTELLTSIFTGEYSDE